MIKYTQAFRQNLQGYGFTVAIGFLPVLSMAGQEQFTIPLLCFTALALATGYRPSIREAMPGIAPIAALILLGILSTLWSLDPAHSLVRAGKLTIWAVAGITVLRWANHPRTPRDATILNVALLAYTCAISYLVVERIMDYPFGHQFLAAQVPAKAGWLIYRAGASFLLMMAVPLICSCLLRAPRLAAAPAALAVYLMFDPSVSFSAKVAFFAAIPIGLLTLGFGRYFVAVAATIFGAFVVAAPWLLGSANFALISDFLGNAPHSALHRLAIWDFTIERIAERPWLGWGLDTSRYIAGGSAIIAGNVLPEALTSLDRWPQVIESGSAMFLPLHPHNAALQVRLELGLPGAVLAAIAVATMIWRTTRKARRTDAAAFLASFTTLFVYGQLSTSVWHSWWISGQILLVAMLFATRHAADEMPLSRR